MRADLAAVDDINHISRMSVKLLLVTRLERRFEQSGTTYDSAGNLTYDDYTGAGTRTYDGENKITSATGGSGQTEVYNYDPSGQRIKRTVDGVQTWQVYGFGGELLAEYPANGAAVSPQKEYGYRNGQLLITAEPATTAAVNVALAANGGVATASSSYVCCGWNFTPANNGNRSGAGWAAVKAGTILILETVFRTGCKLISAAARPSTRSTCLRSRITGRTRQRPRSQ